VENFEENLRKLITNKIVNAKHPLEPSQRDGLETLLEYIFEKALVPAHRVLIEQEDFLESTLNSNDFFGDIVDDGMEDRKMLNLKVVRNKQLLFEYWISFDGDTQHSESQVWRQVEFATHPIDRNDVSIWNFVDNPDYIEPEWKENLPGRTVLSKEVVDLIGIGVEVFSFDIVEAVRFVQEDFYWVCETLL